MTAKDSALFEVSKHNDFSVLCSDDEEMTTSTITTEAATGVSAPRVETSAAPLSEEADGFETFTTVRKVKRVSQSKSGIPSASASASTATSTTARPLGKVKEVVIPKAETSIELYEFPSTLKTVDLRKFLNDFDGHYRLKWINDTSCYVVFDEESLVERALNELKDENIKIKPYVEPVVESTESSTA